MTANVDKLRTLSRSMTQKELATHFGVSSRTIKKWTENHGIGLGFKCFVCNEVKPRTEQKTQRRCVPCDNEIAAGTCVHPRKCSDCSQVKPTNEYFRNAKTNKVSSICIECQHERWNALWEEKREAKQNLHDDIKRLCGLVFQMPKTDAPMVPYPCQPNVWREQCEHLHYC